MGLIIGIFVALIFIIVVAFKDFFKMWSDDDPLPVESKIGASIFFGGMVFGVIFVIVYAIAK